MYLETFACLSGGDLEHLCCAPPLPAPSALYALEPSSQALGKGLEVENTPAETDQHTDLPTLAPKKALFNSTMEA